MPSTASAMKPLRARPYFMLSLLVACRFRCSARFPTPGRCRARVLPILSASGIPGRSLDLSNISALPLARERHSGVALGHGSDGEPLPIPFRSKPDKKTQCTRAEGWAALPVRKGLPRFQPIVGEAGAQPFLPSGHRFSPERHGIARRRRPPAGAPAVPPGRDRGAARSVEASDGGGRYAGRHDRHGHDAGPWAARRYSAVAGTSNGHAGPVILHAQPAWTRGRH